jgi:phosphoglycolate phosphatase
VTPLRARALLLDLDGTLLDTAPDMAGALNRLRAEEGLGPLPFSTIRPYVSHGGMALVRLGFTTREPKELEALRQRFLAIYSQDVSSGTTVIDGFCAVLDALDDRQLPWGIVTNKPGWLTEPLLAALHLRDRAGCIVAGDTLPERKPHPRPLLYAAEQLDCPPGDCLYVGDAERDVIAARAAGMRVLVVRFGYLAPGEDPAVWAPDGIIDHPRDVLAWLELPT